MPRGGPRSGRPGAQYSNRSDLQSAPRLAPAANVDQPYGTAKAQLDTQAQMPMGPPPVPLNAPTARPSEPVQSGLSLGPGAGPDSIPALAPPDSIDPDIATFAPYIAGLEQLANLPNASSATRNLIRRLRSAIPPEMPT
jgi:hypothetical protein